MQNGHPLTNQNRHLSDRLIRAIESNAEEFAQSTVKKLRSSPRTESYHNLPDKDMYNRCYEVYRNLGRWLWEKSDQAIQARFNELGERRRQEGIPLAEVLWALVLTKDHLLEYLGAYGLADSAMELYQQQELDRLIGHFFDRLFAIRPQVTSAKHPKKRQPSRNPDRGLLAIQPGGWRLAEVLWIRLLSPTYSHVPRTE